MKIELDNETKVISILSGYVRQLKEGQDYLETTYKTAESVVKICSIPDISDSKTQELKTLISSLPKMRWNIAEEEGYFGDEWDNWEHMDEDERFEYFGKMFSTIKKIKDIINIL